MANVFMDALRQVDKAMKDSISLSHNGDERFCALVGRMSGQSMSDSDYLKVLMMYYSWYDQRKNEKAKMYCTLQMQRLLLAQNKPLIQTMYPKIMFDKNLDPAMVQFVERKRPFYEGMFQRASIKWDLMSTLACVLLMVLLVLLIRFSFWRTLIFIALVWLFLLALGQTYVIPVLIQERMENLTSVLSPEHQKLERGMGMRAPCWNPEIFRLQFQGKIKLLNKRINSQSKKFML